MAYRQSYIVVATVGDTARIMGPFTTADKAQDFIDRLAARPGMEDVAMSVLFIRKPKVLESAAALREFLS